MLLSINKLKGYSLNAEDGNMGNIKDFLFNDLIWVIRYMVANTRGWLLGRQVLLSPVSFDTCDHNSTALTIRLTKKQIKDSPPLESDNPVSSQYEIDLYQYFGWPTYWTGGMLWGPVSMPAEAYLHSQKSSAAVVTEKEKGDPHLRSMAVVSSYKLIARDGEAGKIDDFIIDDASWVIRYLIVETVNQTSNKKVVINPTWIDKIKFRESLVYTGLSTKEVEDCPEYDSSGSIDRDFMERLHNFYKRPYYK